VLWVGQREQIQIVCGAYEKENKKEKGGFMRKLLSFSVVLLASLLLVGCASLEKIVEDVQEIDATTEIDAVSTLTGDILDNPWDNIVQVGIGYALALLRRKYKISRGMR